MFFDGAASSRKEVNLGGKRKGLSANAKDKASFVEQVASPSHQPHVPLSFSHSKPSPCDRSRPFALSAKLYAAANTGAVTHARPDFTIGSFIPPAIMFSCVRSASKLAATWRAFACRRTLLSNFEQKRQSNLESFIDMPSPASLSSCVQSFNATHRCCSSLCVLQSSSHHSRAALECLTLCAQIRVASSPQLCRVFVVVCLRSVQHATIIIGIPLHVARGPSCFASESM